MISKHVFYRMFDKLSREQRFALIELPPEPTSFFVIFQQLTQVRKQIEFFEEKERQLLKEADIGFQKLQ